MKLKLTIAAMFGCLACHAAAATYAIDNGSGATAAGIVDLDGRAFRSGTTAGASFPGAAGGFSAGAGVIAIGVFSTDDFQGGFNATSLVTSFTNFGNKTSEFAAAGPAGNRGVFSFASPNVEIDDSAFEGKNIYLLVGNGTSFANSDQFLIVRSDSLFSAADDAVETGIPIVFSPETSTVLWGSVVNNVLTTSGDTSQTQGWSLAAATPVPEPSTAMLGALSALALIRRKR